MSRQASYLQFTEDLVPNLVDKRASSTPDAIYAKYPVSTLTYDKGYRTITYRGFANAVNGAARWLVDILGHGENFETLAYIGPNDLRYPAFILGAVKAGYKLFLTSPRNSIAAQIHLFDRLECTVLLSSNPRPPAVTAIASHRDFPVFEVPSVSYLLDTQHKHFAFEKTWPDARSEPLFVIHTSGSTGIPKPLLYTHATAATNTKMMSLDPPVGYESQDRVYQGKAVFIAFPPFHGAYLVSHLFNAISFGTVMVAPTSGALLSGEGLVEALENTSVDIAMIVPSIVQDLAHSPRLLDYCSKHLETIIYCGGDLPQAIGDIVASKIRLLNQFGASELGLTPNLLSLTNRDREDWRYAQFHPEVGLELRHVSEGVHELYAVRDPGRKDVQPTFTIFPEVQEYASRDLFVRHLSEDKPDLWSWQARADDIIVFLNGEKTNPVSMEQYIVTRNRDISAALVIGAQRFQAALLIEPVTEGKALNPAERAAFIERIWPTVEDANKEASSHARITKSHIVFTQPQKPLLRAGKGTIQRAGTLNSYAKEINALYRDADSLPLDLEGAIEVPKGTVGEETVMKCIRRSVLSTVECSGLDDSADLFELGMNSLQTLSLVRILRQRLVLPIIAPSTVYTNPSVLSLTAAIMRLLNHEQTSKTAQEQRRTEARNDMVEEYKRLIDERFKPASGIYTKNEQEIVILTGSTGSLGTHILDNLLSHSKVAQIYCLNRANDSQSIQMKKSETIGLQPCRDDKRISFMTVDLGQKYFDLTKDEYDDIVSRTTLVIHNAWTVNFNLPLSSFRAQLDGLVNLLSLAKCSAKSARFFYVSSISSVMSYHTDSGKTPEKPTTSESAPATNGYAESKYVAEQIIDYAAQTVSPGALLSFARVGQIAGAVTHPGLWNKNEWFPSMIISSLLIGALPDSLGPMFNQVDWVPVDLIAGILVELAFNDRLSAATDSVTQHANVYHPLNPCKTTWTALKAIVLDELNSKTKTPIETVSLRKWIAKVREVASSVINNGDGTDSAALEVALGTNPAAKLLDFYEDMITSENVNQLETSETLKMSEMMGAMEPIRDDWVRKWIREWCASPKSDETP